MAIARQSLKLLKSNFRKGSTLFCFLLKNKKDLNLFLKRSNKFLSRVLFCPRLPVKSLIATGDGGLTVRVSQIEKKMFSTSKILSQEQIEDLQKNPFFDKYAEKIAKLQKYA